MASAHDQWMAAYAATECLDEQTKQMLRGWLTDASTIIEDGESRKACELIRSVWLEARKSLEQAA